MTPKQDPKWRPIDEIHEGHFPILVASSKEPSTNKYLDYTDDWNELSEEEQARYDLFHSVKFLFAQGYCEQLDAAAERWMREWTDGVVRELLVEEAKKEAAPPPPALDPHRVGIAVYCHTCSNQKKPRGRSAPLGSCYCDSECSGYYQDPKAGDLWPGESEADFGYPTSVDGTTFKPAEETQHA